MKSLALLVLVFLLLSIDACAQRASDSAGLNALLASADPTEVVTFKNASCGCCSSWVHHMQSAGFKVRVENVADLTPIRESLGVPANYGSCHTAHVGKFFIEGHVPAEDVKRLLALQLPAKGLIVPGMPNGSPGMTSAGGHQDPYDVLLVALDGTVTVFAHHGS